MTFNIAIKIYSIICTIYSSRLLINTICRVCLVFFSNMTNSSTSYINTTIRTNNSTFILINTICRICLVFFSNISNSSTSYINTTIFTFNFTINLYSINITFYSTTHTLIKTWYCSLNISRILLNTICRTSSISNSTIHINTTIRTFNCTIYINTIFIFFELSTCIYYNTTTTIYIVTLNITIN